MLFIKYFACIDDIIDDIILIKEKRKDQIKKLQKTKTKKQNKKNKKNKKNK